jgi:putative exosortase-associated protein (TIGR04073 family)
LAIGRLDEGAVTSSRTICFLPVGPGGEQEWTMRKTEEAVWHHVGRMMIVAVGLFAVVALTAGPAMAGDTREEREMMPVETASEESEVTSAAVVSEDGGPACDVYPSREPEVEPLWKLGRGFHNLVFGFPAEVVRNPVIEILKADTIFGVGAGAFEGVVVGVGKGFWRVGAGFLDIVTFPAPIAPWYDCDHLPKYPF